ncbi:hypothetical protein HDA32_005950 [Spinactinospora alkalitolerans]|uniref:Uncharacterized protein n=1 Tax=Spinactinospora alkalitolerans TaxID=687207 RepID=A0A852UA39_9ACTN|nr:hypothetical protein [Spinactinospora alkalitolerans]NYE50830.1 hypothetical protein [Spinactinospora alkalitolerans]
MSYSVPTHPYSPQTRVHHITEQDHRVFARGAGSVVDAQAGPDGGYRYAVRRDSDGATVEWPSYETIPAGIWPSVPAEGDGAREL